MYRPTDPTIWKGRNDGNDEGNLRWHQVVQCLSFEEVQKCPPGIALLGFASDEGVRRNQGRVGARRGPEALRRALGNLAVHFDEQKVFLYDFGDVVVSGQQLEAAQEELANRVEKLLMAGCFPILMGGGHEIAYGHGLGVMKHALQKDRTAGVINFDAHLDVRPYDSGAHSGSPFLQLHDFLASQDVPFRYLSVGINPASNTRSLFQTVNSWQQPVITLHELFFEQESVKSQIQQFLSEVDDVYLTLDMDVFPAAYAPGVSAPAAIGPTPEVMIYLLRVILDSGKLRSFDVAEVNPEFDDGRTAKLAALFIYDVVSFL